MNRSSLAPVLTVLAVAACSATGSGGNEATPASAPQLTAMLVIQGSGPLSQGDTVRVDLGSLSEMNRVAYYEDGRRAGTVEYDALGPAGTGTMMVSASALNVRKCRSTGCSVVGRVSRGQMVRVRDFRGRWYRYAGDDGTQGYLNAEHLVIPDAYRGRLLAGIHASIAAYYDRELAALTVSGYGKVFSGYDIRRAEDELKFEFYTPYRSGPAAGAACDAMDGISDVVQRAMAQVPGEYFPAFSAGVYYDDPDRRDDEVMVAGMTAGGGAFCASGN